tara:strand:- start:203 stop:319 length:117 start_codon:yes stop_codon:yes gene_type:complete
MEVIIQMSTCKNYFKNRKGYKNTEWVDDLINKLITKKK